MSYIEELKDRTVEDLLEALSDARSFLVGYIQAAWEDGDGKIQTSDEYIIDNVKQTIHEIEEEVKSRGVVLAEDAD